VEHFYSLLAAVLLDQFIGEFSFAHPLVGFGNLASRLELVLNKQEYANKK
jgi:cobalamin biosynthesis protein CobD/CbiB